MTRDYFFCYSKSLCLFLKRKGVYSITTGLHPTTMKKFTLFLKDEALQCALDQYEKEKITNNRCIKT